MKVRYREERQAPAGQNPKFRVLNCLPNCSHSQSEESVTFLL
jgi:hypothetical protein